MKFIKYLSLVFVLLTLGACGESLEDTYKDYAGNGEIRYLGKCSDIAIRPGWNRLIVSWKNGTDPVIDKVKVTWKKDDTSKFILLDRGTTEYSIPDLEDGNYEVTVCSVDKQGNTSLVSTIYGRPYTKDHEVVRSFTNIISRHFFIRDRLVLLFLGWESNVKEAYLTYTKKDGSKGRLDLTEEVVNKLYYLLPDTIDSTKPVDLYRSGYIEGCEDLIVFEPTVLETEKLFNADFKQAMKRQFGFDQDISTEWADSVTEIDFDWTMGDFADLMNLPKLKKVVLGKHRYPLPEMVDDKATGQSKVYDAALSDFALKTLHELNGLTVERYNKHYSTLTPASYIIEKGSPEIPAYKYLNLKGLKFVSVPEDEDGYNSHLDYLTDGLTNSIWTPYATTSATTYTLELDLKEVKMLRGIKLVQSYYDSFNTEQRVKCPGLVKLFVSEDFARWENATYIEDLEIGNSTGETNIIPFKGEGMRARYVRLMVNSAFYIRAYEISLAEIGLYE